jgi:hypothetical protein
MWSLGQVRIRRLLNDLEILSHEAHATVHQSSDAVLFNAQKRPANWLPLYHPTDQHQHILKANLGISLDLLKKGGKFTEFLSKNQILCKLQREAEIMRN